jgi:lipid A 4'-phosphatase
LACYGGLVVLAAALFTFFPGIDRWAAGLFYRQGFPLADNSVLHVLFRLVYIVSDGLAVGLPLLLIVVLLRRRPLFGLDCRALAFLIVALAIGPGLIVNTMLKDHWGRARPSQIVEFDGTKQFTPALEPADECNRNCSFPSGHAAIGFYLLSFALLIPAARPRRWIFAGAILAGALIGLMRMAQGGHFLSDVVFSGLIVMAVSWLAHDLIVRRGGIAGTAGGRRVILVGLICVLVGAISFLLYDRPVAVAAHGVNPRFYPIFAFITRFGVSTAYLIICAVAFVGFHLLGRRSSFRAWQAAFIFATIAVSGLAVDLLKVIFGRARPILLFREQLYGFTWFGGRHDLWSFPSGHAATASALASCLTLFWPRLWLAWWLAATLICASRIMVGAHYPSDLLGGFYIAFVTVWALRAGFDRLGLRLKENP